jgi:conjugative relaxase-like TrwC/TraI family protein
VYFLVKTEERIGLHLAAISRTSYIDYLQKETTGSAYWHGKGAELLGIDGEEITRESFVNLATGIDPVHGEVLRTRERYNLTRNGEIIARSRLFYDCGLSPGKSVSIVSMIDKRIHAAHSETVKELAPKIEALAATRVRKNYAEENRTTGNLVYAPFHHGLSRSLDPQVHTHLIIMNLTHDPVENKWKALQAYPIFKNRFPLHEAYREILYEKVADLGYQVEERTDRNGGWEIEGITPRMMEKYSQRSAEISEAKEEYREEHNQEPGPRAVVRLARSHRPPKQYPPADEVREMQLARLTPSERSSLIRLRDEAKEREASYSLDLNDNVVHESESPIHANWNYGERPKQKAF